MLAKRFLFDQVFDVAVASTGAAFPPSFLWAPGSYTFGGINFDMTACGVYLFYDPIAGSYVRCAITNTDPMQMASCFALMTAYGSEDDGQALTTYDSIARTRRVRIACGSTSEWALKWLKSAGFTARIVRFITTTTPNNYSDGHVCVEILYNGSWALVDMALGRYYVDTNGVPLSARDFIANVPSYGFTIKPLCLPQSKLDTSPSSSGKFVEPIYNEMSFYNDAAIQQWVQRICQCIGIDASDGNTYWRLPAGEGQAYINWVQSLSSTWKVDTDPAVWNSRFY